LWITNNGGLHADHSLVAGSAACGGHRVDVDTRHLMVDEERTDKKMRCKKRDARTDKKTAFASFFRNPRRNGGVFIGGS
jgi:hypothetical protein